MLQTVTRKGRPPLGPAAMPEADRKARSRATRNMAQLNVEVPIAVRDALHRVAEQTGQTQAQILLAALAAYLKATR